MHPVAIMLAVAALGVDYGWQPGEDGQLEYIIQIQPELIKTLSEGKVDLLSEIPEELRGVNRFRIRVGTGEVPRIGLENVKASNIAPAENIAPALGSGRPLSTTRSGTGDPRGSPTGGNFPPTNQPGQQGTNPQGGAATGGNNNTFPPLGRSPAGISRDDPAAGDRFNNSGGNVPPLTDPLRNDGGQTGTSTPWNSRTDNNLNTSGWQTGDSRTAQTNQNGTNPNNLTDPRMTPINDPRFQTAQTPGLPEVRRDNSDPRFNQPPYNPQQQPYNQPPQNQPPYNQPPWGYGQPPANYAWNGYNTQPLRDPEGNPYYGPPNYAQMATRPPTAATTAPPAEANPGTAATTPPTTPTKNTSARATSDRYAEDAAKPWLPLTFTAMLLFASIGLNFYLGWIAQGIYQRYRALLMEVRNVRATAM
jgi:hypothetical protein